MNKDFIIIFFQKYQIKKKHGYKFLKFSGTPRISPNTLQCRHLGLVYYQTMYQWASHHTWPILYGLKRCLISFVKNKKSNLQGREYWNSENTNKQIYLLNPCLFM